MKSRQASLRRRQRRRRRGWAALRRHHCSQSLVVLSVKVIVDEGVLDGHAAADTPEKRAANASDVAEKAVTVLLHTEPDAVGTLSKVRGGSFEAVVLSVDVVADRLTSGEGREV